jgi:tetratricopeptide (TPR) repeat protein
MLQINELNELIHESAKKLAEAIVKETPETMGLQSSKARVARYTFELEEHIKKLDEKMHDGLQAASFALNECSNPLMSVKEVVDQLYTSLSTIQSTAEFSKLGQDFMENRSWKSHLGISDQCMDALYQGANYIFDKKDYPEAENAFFTLCLFDPIQFDYWVGLGHSAFQNKNNELAIRSYSMASMLNPENLWPHVWAANTFEQNQDFDHAKIALDCAMSLSQAERIKDQSIIQFLENKMQNVKPH